MRIIERIISLKPLYVRLPALLTCVAHCGRCHLFTAEQEVVPAPTGRAAFVSFLAYVRISIVHQILLGHSNKGSIGRTYSTHEEEEKFMENIFRNFEGKRRLWRYSRRWDNNVISTV